MYAIILNSGIGSRLGHLTDSNPKGLIELRQGESILSRQIDLLVECGIENIIVTTGYLADQIEEYLKQQYNDLDIRCVLNEKYDTTNYIVSLDKLKDIPFDKPVILMHGDLVFELEVLQRIINQGESCVVIDRSAPIPEKDFKARVTVDGFVKEIGVGVFGEGCFSCQPLYKMEIDFWRAWQDKIHEFCLAGTTSVYAENALNLLLGELPLKAFDIEGRMCTEIDTLEDYETVRLLLKDHL